MCVRPQEIYSGCMAPQAAPRRRPAGRRKKKSSLRWSAWWPLLLAVVATPFAVRTAEILPLMGTTGLDRLRLLFPFALLVQQQYDVSQGLMYAQFPFYAVVLVLIRAKKSFLFALSFVIVLHLMALAAVWLLPAF